MYAIVTVLFLCVVFLGADFYHMYDDSIATSIAVVSAKLIIFVAICVLSTKPFVFLLPLYLIAQS